MLEYEKMKWIKNINVSEEDLLLVTIIQRILPYIQQIDLHGFYEICRCIFEDEPKLRGNIANLIADIDIEKWNENYRS